MSPQWFDSHCHLFGCEESPEDVLERARAACVTEVLVAGIDEGSSAEALRLASSRGVYAAVGVHPNETSSWDASSRSVVEELARRPAAVAIGETGLDFFRDASPREQQRAAFRSHIALAAELGKALVVHTRESVDAALDELEGTGATERVVFHCWSGTRVQLQRALALGAHISFAGNVTFKRNGELRALAAAVPSDRLLVETDSPYLAPEPRRGRPNEPANAPLVGACVAEARAEPVAEVAQRTRANARRLFRVA